MKILRLTTLLSLAAACATTVATPPDSRRADEALARAALPARDPEHAVLLGICAVGDRMVAVGERGLILLSGDAGATWRQAPSPVSVTLTGVRFADARNGWAVGHGGTVLGTTDSGATWTRQLDGRRIADLELAAAKASGDAAALKSAERLQADGPDKPLLDLLVFDARRVLVIGAYGLAMFTEDGGGTWTSWRSRLDNPKELHLYAARRRGAALVLAGEQGLVLRSGDGGQSFRRLTLPYRGSFFTAELPSDHTILVAGLRGNVWQSTDEGTNWSQLASPVPASVTASALGADGAPLLVNQAGLLLTVLPDGLRVRPGAALPPLNAALPLPGGSVIALSMQGVHRLASTTAKREP